jgi:hypothetical protein
MTDLYTTQYSNPQRNSNTTLQSSTLQSANNLSKIYSLQSIRTIKGVAYFPIDTTRFDQFYSPITATVPVINEYDGSPIKFDPADVIISASIANGSQAFATDNNNAYPNPFITGTIQFKLSQIPTFNSMTTGYWNFPVGLPPYFNQISGNWVANTSGNPQPIHNIFTLTNLGAALPSSPVGQNLAVIYNNSVGSVNNTTESLYSGGYQWLNCSSDNMRNTFDFDTSFNTTQVPAVNITLMVLNSLV